MYSKRNREKGAIIPLFAIILPALIGALGLAVDTGSMYDETRRMQISTRLLIYY
jgi:Flp pilus assembly protein TadG